MCPSNYDYLNIYKHFLQKALELKLPVAIAKIHLKFYRKKNGQRSVFCEECLYMTI